MAILGVRIQWLATTACILTLSNQAHGDQTELESIPRSPMRVVQVDQPPARLAQALPPTAATPPSNGYIYAPTWGTPWVAPGGTPPAPPGGGFGPSAAPPMGANFNENSLIRQPTTISSPYGRQPLSPYSQGDFNSDAVDADLVVGLTPSANTLHYGAGIGFNSDLGVFGQFIYDDQNFDCRATPWRNPPTPWRGGGQRLRLEALPGNEAQRYLISFTEPFCFWCGSQPIGLNLSAFFFDRDYYDWDERRYGARIRFRSKLSRQLVFNATARAEGVEITNPRKLVPELTRSLGKSELYGIGVSLAYDTRDKPYAPTEGGHLNAEVEWVFGTFSYPRGVVRYKRYQWIRQRPDFSGRHVIAWHFNGGITGSQTPVYENFFAGGFSTLRGFRFRHASPRESDVIVGGELSLLGSVEYFFPVTADDMVRGVFFTDFGNVEANPTLSSENFRLAIGGGLRIFIPALGPAPLAIDASVPLRRVNGDRVQNVAFLVSVGQ